MQIILYNTENDNNVLNKTLTNSVSYNIKLKNDTNIQEPIIILKTDDIINSNYAYIEKFGRYYFIEDVSINSNDIYTITLRCDVLMSFKEDILNSYAYIKQQTNVNEYYNSNYQSEVKKEVDIYKSDMGIGEDNSIILLCVGGVGIG